MPNELVACLPVFVADSAAPRPKPRLLYIYDTCFLLTSCRGSHPNDAYLAQLQAGAAPSLVKGYGLLSAIDKCFAPPGRRLARPFDHPRASFKTVASVPPPDQPAAGQLIEVRLLTKKGKIVVFWTRSEADAQLVVAGINAAPQPRPHSHPNLQHSTPPLLVTLSPSSTHSPSSSIHSPSSSIHSPSSSTHFSSSSIHSSSSSTHSSSSSTHSSSISSTHSSPSSSPSSSPLIPSVSFSPATFPGEQYEPVFDPDDWLASLGLQRYASDLQSHGVDSLAALRELSAQSLHDMCGVSVEVCQYILQCARGGDNNNNKQLLRSTSKRLSKRGSAVDAAFQRSSAVRELIDSETRYLASIMSLQADYIEAVQSFLVDEPPPLEEKKSTQRQQADIEATVRDLLAAMQLSAIEQASKRLVDLLTPFLDDSPSVQPLSDSIQSTIQSSDSIQSTIQLSDSIQSTIQSLSDSNQSTIQSLSDSNQQSTNVGLGAALLSFFTDDGVRAALSNYLLAYPTVLAMSTKLRDASASPSAWVNRLYARIESTSGYGGTSGFNGFASLLGAPYQRAFRYLLLIKQIVDSTDEQHDDYEPLLACHAVVAQLVSDVNEAQRRHDRAKSRQHAWSSKNSLKFMMNSRCLVCKSIFKWPRDATTICCIKCNLRVHIGTCHRAVKNSPCHRHAAQAGERRRFLGVKIAGVRCERVERRHEVAVVPAATLYVFTDGFLVATAVAAEQEVVARIRWRSGKHRKIVQLKRTSPDRLIVIAPHIADGVFSFVFPAPDRLDSFLACITPLIPSEAATFAATAAVPSARTAAPVLRHQAPVDNARSPVHASSSPPPQHITPLPAAIVEQLSASISLPAEHTLSVEPIPLEPIPLEPIPLEPIPLEPIFPTLEPILPMPEPILPMPEQIIPTPTEYLPGAETTSWPATDGFVPAAVLQSLKIPPLNIASSATQRFINLRFGDGTPPGQQL